MFDPNCWAYWCDTEDCGKEMTIIYAECTEENLVLGCKACGSRHVYKEIPNAQET